MAPISYLVRGRKMTVHNNLLGDAKNTGIDYVDSDVVVDGDLVSARTGGEHVQFAQRIIALINCRELFTSLTSRIDFLEAKLNSLVQKPLTTEKLITKKIGGHSMAKVLIIATNYGSWAEELQAQWVCAKIGKAASFMAAGYAMFSKKLGVYFATGDPGAFNLFSGLAVAYSDSFWRAKIKRKHFARALLKISKLRTNLC